MIKQRKLQFRIRKCRRVKGMLVTSDTHSDTQSMFFQSFYRTIDEKTEMKEEINEQVQIKNHYDLQKQRQFPKIHALNQEYLVKDSEDAVNQQTYDELPSLKIARNPQIQEQIKEVNILQQKQQLSIVSAKQQQNVQQVHQQVEVNQLPSQQQSSTKHVPEQQSQITQFSIDLKSPTISLNESSSIATQMSSYWQNKKLILSQPVNNKSKAIFKVINLKYCVGMGMALKEIIQKHEYNYKSYENELSHGLFLVTSQGYSWSHVYKTEDDFFRGDFKKMQSNDTIEVTLIGDKINFSYKKTSFSLSIPESVREKYTLCFCTYLHEKTDSVGLEFAQSSQNTQFQA